MLDPLSIHTVLPVTDLDRARTFDREKLGLEPTMVKPGMLAYSGPSGYIFQLYVTDTAGTAQNTQMGWSTGDLRRRWMRCARTASCSRSTTFRASRPRTGSRSSAPSAARGSRTPRAPRSVCQTLAH